jgi:hypothetical protein
VREKFRQVQPLIPIVLRPITWQLEVIQHLADTGLRRKLTRVTDDISESLRAGGAWVGEHLEDMTAFVGEKLRVRETDALGVSPTQRREQKRKDRQDAKQQRAERRANNPPEQSLQKNALLIFLNLKAIEVEFDKIGWQRFDYDALNPVGRTKAPQRKGHLKAAEAEHRGRVEPVIRLLREFSVLAERVEKEWTGDKSIPREYRDQAARVSDVAGDFASVLMRNGERFKMIFELLGGGESVTSLASVSSKKKGTKFAAAYKDLTDRFGTDLDALFKESLYRQKIYDSLKKLDDGKDAKQKKPLAGDAINLLDPFIKEVGDDKVKSKAKDPGALKDALRELSELRRQVHELQ